MHSMLTLQASICKCILGIFHAQIGNMCDSPPLTQNLDDFKNNFAQILEEYVKIAEQKRLHRYQCY